MAWFREVAELAEGLAREAGRLKTRAAIAAAISRAHAEAPGGGGCGVVCAVCGRDSVCRGGFAEIKCGGALLSKALRAGFRGWM